MDVEQTIRDYIAPVFHMSLGTVADNKPWVCEVHFAYDDELNVYFRSLLSRRHSQEIAKNPLVAGNIIKPHDLGVPAVGVYFEGTARVLEPGDEQTTAFHCLQDRLHAPDTIFEEAKSPDGHQFYKINVTTWYLFGSFDGKPGKKYELQWPKDRSNA